MQPTRLQRLNRVAISDLQKLLPGGKAVISYTRAMKALRLLPFVVLFVLGGCRSEESKFVGAWNGLGSILDLNADKSYKCGKVVGKWWYKNYRIHLEPTFIQGQSVQDLRALFDYTAKQHPERTKELESYEQLNMAPMDCRVSSDGNAFFVTSPAGNMTVNRIQ